MTVARNVATRVEFCGRGPHTRYLRLHACTPHAPTTPESRLERVGVGKKHSIKRVRALYWHTVLTCVLCEWEGDRDQCRPPTVGVCRTDGIVDATGAVGRAPAVGRSVGRSDGMLALSWSLLRPSGCNLIKLKTWKRRGRDRRPGLCVKMNNEEIAFLSSLPLRTSMVTKNRDSRRRRSLARSPRFVARRTDGIYRQTLGGVVHDLVPGRPELL